MTLILLFITAFALIMSFITEFKKRGADSLALTIWKYFSYYTTLSNTLVLIMFAGLSFWSEHEIGLLLKDANVVAAITFYIVTVGIANYLIYGWQALSFHNRISDLLVHAVVPFTTAIYWLLEGDKQNLEFSKLGYWFIFPIAYAVYTMIHGKWSKFYPYDFTNIQELGLKVVLLNTLGLTFSLFIGSSIFILFGQTIGRF